jgi:hypothetical protein
MEKDGKGVKGFNDDDTSDQDIGIRRRMKNNRKGEKVQ